MAVRFLSGSRSATAVAIKRRYSDFVNQRFSSTRLRVAARAVALRELELIRDRTQRGLNKSGSKMKGITTGYRNRKLQIIRDGWKVGRGRGGKRRLVSIGPTAFAATNSKQFMRLSGRMFSDMYVKGLRVRQEGENILIDYQLDFKTARSKKIADYHINKGVGKSKVKRDFWGPIRGKDQEKLDRVLRRELGL